MSVLLWISIAGNVVLGAVLFLAVYWFCRECNSMDKCLEIERKEAVRYQRNFDLMHADYNALAEAVATSLEEIRDDINRNYQHTHDWHVLDRFAHALRRDLAARPAGVPGIWSLNHYDLRDVEEAGFKLDGGMMNLGQLLAFAWHQHTMARTRAIQLFEVVRQPCGNGAADQALWLSKTLAMYELMCDRNKDLAIERLAAVMDAWRFVSAESAVAVIQDRDA